MRIHVFTLLFCICFVSLLHSQETVELPYIEDLAPDMKETLQEEKERFELYDEASGKEINNSASFMGIVFRGDNINSLPLHHEFRHLMVNILSHHDTYIEQFLNEGLAESADTFMPDEEMPYHRYKIQDLYYHYQRKYLREPTWLEIHWMDEKGVDSWLISPPMDVSDLDTAFVQFMYKQQGEGIRKKVIMPPILSIILRSNQLKYLLYSLY